MKSTRALSQYKDHLSRYGKLYYKDKTVVRPSYLYYGNSYTGRMIFILKRATDPQVLQLLWWAFNIAKHKSIDGVQMFYISDFFLYWSLEMKFLALKVPAWNKIFLVMAYWYYIWENFFLEDFKWVEFQASLAFLYVVLLLRSLLLREIRLRLGYVWVITPMVLYEM